jgi:hypothetical protein
MASAAQAQPTPTTTDPVQRWLARRGACPQLDPTKIGSPAPSLSATDSKAHRPPSAAPNQRGTSAELAAPEASPLCASFLEAHPITINPTPAPIPNPQSPTPEHRTRANRANARLSTGPRTGPGKQRSSLNALRHGLTAQTAVLPNEDPEAYQRHIQQFLDEYAPATPTETQLVHEIANTAWRLNRIPFLEAELLSQNPSPQSLIPLATLGLHGSRLSRQFQKALDQLRTIQGERRHLERRQLTEAAELFLRHKHKGLPWEPGDDGFVFSRERVERQARQLIRNNPAFYATLRGFQANPPPTGATS